MHADHPHRPVDALIGADGSVRVPPPLVGPLRGVLLRFLADCARREGAQPSPDLRALLWALRAAEHPPASASGSPPAGPPIVEISTSEAADTLGATTSYVRQLCRAGAVSARRPGRDWLIDRASLDA